MLFNRLVSFDSIGNRLITKIIFESVTMNCYSMGILPNVLLNVIPISIKALFDNTNTVRVGRSKKSDTNDQNQVQ